MKPARIIIPLISVNTPHKGLRFVLDEGPGEGVLWMIEEVKEAVDSLIFGAVIKDSVEVRVELVL
jgi:hypothetical protein